MPKYDGACMVSDERAEQDRFDEKLALESLAGIREESLFELGASPQTPGI